MTDSYIALDLETTGLEPKKEKIKKEKFKKEKVKRERAHIKYNIGSTRQKILLNITGLAEYNTLPISRKYITVIKEKFLRYHLKSGRV